MSIAMLVSIQNNKSKDVPWIERPSTKSSEPIHCSLLFMDPAPNSKGLSMHQVGLGLFKNQGTLSSQTFRHAKHLSTSSACSTVNLQLFIFSFGRELPSVGDFRKTQDAYLKTEQRSSVATWVANLVSCLSSHHSPPELFLPELFLPSPCRAPVSQQKPEEIRHRKRPTWIKTPNQLEENFISTFLGGFCCFFSQVENLLSLSLCFLLKTLTPKSTLSAC